MKKKETSTTTRKTVKKTTASRPNKSRATASSEMQTPQLMKLFENELRDIYWAEKALAKVYPKMIKNATSDELIVTLTHQQRETVEQVDRLVRVFEHIDKKPVAKKCDGMAGIIMEAESILRECEKGAMRDAGIILSCQKAEHYEIATYGTLRQFAETLGLDDAVEILHATLEEEKAGNEKLTEIAVTTINLAAAGKIEEVEFESSYR